MSSDLGLPHAAGSTPPPSPERSVLSDELRATLARNLSAARTALSLSQEQIAQKAGISRATIVQIESAQGDPRLSTVADLAQAMGIAPFLLLLSREDLDAITHVARSADTAKMSSAMTDDKTEQITRLLRSEIPKNRAKAVTIGAVAASSAGFTAGTIAAAAIGTALIPGIGTAIGVGLAAWMIGHKTPERNDK
jgi:transcriptional regulator with XRE-family HTH domain